MIKFVTPVVHLVGSTFIHIGGLQAYLRSIGAKEFEDEVAHALKARISDAEIMCSIYAKLCYASFKPENNKNLSKTRGIEDNLKQTLAAAHTAVFRNASLNFIATGVSRVFTHELVRHSAGWGFAQESGRYVRRDHLPFTWDDRFEPLRNVVHAALSAQWDAYIRICEALDIDGQKDFTKRKELTSLARRFLPNGMANEIAFSVNLCALRHFVQMRTSRHAEREMRLVAAEIYRITKGFCPILFHDAREELVDGIVEVTRMKVQPYA